MPNGWGDVAQAISLTGVPDSFLALGYDVYGLVGPDYNSLAWTKMNTTPLTTANTGNLQNLSPASSYHVGAAYQVMAIGVTVPEPSTFVLAGLGLAGLSLGALRKKFHRVALSSRCD